MALIDKAAADTLPLYLVGEGGFKAWAKAQGPVVADWCAANGFRGQAGRVLVLPGAGGAPAGAVAGVPGEPDLWSFAHLPRALPARSWRLGQALKALLADKVALGFLLGTYGFHRYRKPERELATLLWPRSADRAGVRRVADAIFMVRDLVNTPAADLGPSDLAQAAHKLADQYEAELTVIEGDALLSQRYPMIHAVGRASSRPPLLIDLRWGERGQPKVVLAGKGVVFDSGGLDIKPAAGMQIMKKDMGGAAVALGLARCIMDARLPVHLRVLIPAAENAIGPNAFRPLDVLTSRAGITVEVGNTDAEGRLILADALTEAVADKPDLLIDFATLTGAARVALGPDLPALFTDDDVLADELLRHGRAQADPLWRLPLHKGYRERINSRVADINSTGDDGMAGAITAALFLKEFAGKAKSWAHIDLYAWNQKPRPGRPAGGEAHTLRAIWSLLQDRYGSR